jgi:hypothetical protein
MPEVDSSSFRERQASAQEVIVCGRSLEKGIAWQRCRAKVSG